MPRHEDRIRRILAEKEEEPGDHSLCGHALRRAVDGETPRTLTPWEWQECYAAHGQPEALKPPPRWLRWLRGVLRRE